MDQVLRKEVNPRLLLLAVVLAVQFVVVPVRQASAAFPALAVASMFMKTPLGKSLMASLALHAGVLAVEFHNTSNAGAVPASDADKRLDVKLSPSAPMDTPAGWTPPASGSAEPIAPATATGVSSQNFCLPNFGCRTDKQEVATSYCLDPVLFQYVAPANRKFNGWAGGAMVPGTAQGFYCQDVSSSRSVLTMTVSTGTVCPSGYTASGSNCNKTDESAVKKPPKAFAEVKRVGNTFQQDPRSDDGLPANTTITPTDTEFVDGFGNKWNMHINADGTSTVTETKARTDGSGKTDQATIALSAPAAGTGAVEVTGYGTKTYSGTGTQQSATPDPTGGGTSDAKDASLQAIKGSIDGENTKMDADRTAAATAAAGVAGDLEGRKAAGQDTVAGLGLPSQSQFGVQDVTGIGNALPANSGGCVALDVTLPYLGNLHIAPCAVVSAVGPLVDFLVISLGVAGGLFTLLGRREEA